MLINSTELLGTTLDFSDSLPFESTSPIFLLIRSMFRNPSRCTTWNTNACAPLIATIMCMLNKS